MFAKIEGIGEQTINRIAEMALAPKMKKAEAFKVQVKTEPTSLAKGVLESLSIRGKGLEMRPNLRLQEMDIILHTIAVSPWKALRGNIQLIKPALGKACVVLTEGDITHALKAETVQKQLKNYQVFLNGQLVHIDLKQIQFKIFVDRIAIHAEIYIQETQATHPISVTTTPYVCTNGRGVLLENIDCQGETAFTPILTNALLEEAKSIFNLQGFQLKGLSLAVHELSFSEGKLTLQAKAGITEFPV